jgi:hypothetical protein
MVDLGLSLNVVILLVGAMTLSILYFGGAPTRRLICQVVPGVLVLKSLNLEHLDILSYKLYLGGGWRRR